MFRVNINPELGTRDPKQTLMSTQLNLLFVCVENSCRSQMAEALAKRYGGARVNAWSAGSHPRGAVDPRTIDIMKEKGISLDGHMSKGLEALPAATWDAVVGMGCGDTCAFLPAKRHLSWSIPAPGGADLAPYRQARDVIDQRVKELLASFGLESPS